MLVKKCGIILVEVFVDKGKQRLAHPIALVGYLVLFKIILYETILFVAHKRHYAFVTHSLHPCTCSRCSLFLSHYIVGVET